METNLKYFIGIDPGLSGALALFDSAGEPLHLADMPVVEHSRGFVKRKVSGQLLRVILLDWIQTFPELGPNSCKVGIEDVSSMKSQGVSSMFSFGFSCGIVEGCFAILGYEIQKIPPRTWKGKFNLMNRPKDFSRTGAIAKWPGFAGELARKMDCGRADSMWIARFSYESESD